MSLGLSVTLIDYSSMPFSISVFLQVLLELATLNKQFKLIMNMIYKQSEVLLVILLYIFFHAPGSAAITSSIYCMDCICPAFLKNSSPLILEFTAISHTSA